MKDGEIKEMVRERYGNIAEQGSSCCGPAPSCCGTTDPAEKISRGVGYTDEDLKAVPDGANLGLGCGNPVALANLRAGETVLDLGSGAGFDCFLAAKRVGDKGRVIGVDMTPEMIDKARRNSEKDNVQNVEFRLGEIENLPVADRSADVVISNCVINLSPDKQRVFSEAFRVLHPGGRLMISDIVLLRDLPESIKGSVEAYVGCVAGAMHRDAYIDGIRLAGFGHIQIVDETAFPVDLITNDPIAKQIIEDSRITPQDMEEVQGAVVSLKVIATKPNEM
jgi:SAM-dependent methyltransferase